MICCPVAFIVPACVSGRHYTCVLFVPILACAGIGQDLAYSDFLTLSDCSVNIAMTSKKKKHVLEVNYINSGPKNRCLRSF